MVKRNPHVAKLNGNYLFSEINKRKQAFLEKHPRANLISLGIGDTTQPLPSFIASRLAETALALGTIDGYTGYGPEEGQQELRRLIAEQLYQNQFEAEEIFISDGTNSDIGRLQILFGSDAMIAVQDPSYPAYVDTSVILGQAAAYHFPSQKYQGIGYLPCLPSNQFFPSLSEISPPDLIYFCSPNNPTGAVATRSQLEELVCYAKRNRSILIYDAAYARYIQQPDLPRSIYEIKGAKETAIELGSFSKMAGFTGVRLGWSVVPKELHFEDGHSIRQDWNRVHSTFFNGASNISQGGGMAVLHPEGQKSMQSLIGFYMKNAALLYSVFEDLGYEVYGGLNAPFLWVKFPQLNSWQAFDMLLENAHLLTIPGVGFGPSGEGFLRFSAFGHRFHIEEAANRLYTCLKFSEEKRN
jgi:LL-diaminopimelate aminotransferase